MINITAGSVCGGQLHEKNDRKQAHKGEEKINIKIAKQRQNKETNLVGLVIAPSANGGGCAPTKLHHIQYPKDDMQNSKEKLSLKHCHTKNIFKFVEK